MECSIEWNKRVIIIGLNNIFTSEHSSIVYNVADCTIFEAVDFHKSKIGIMLQLNFCKIKEKFS